MEAATPELGPLSLWNPKFSTFGGKRLHCNVLRQPSINKSEWSKLLDKNHRGF